DGKYSYFHCRQCVVVVYDAWASVSPEIWRRLRDGREYDIRNDLISSLWDPQFEFLCVDIDGKRFLGRSRLSCADCIGPQLSSLVCRVSEVRSYSRSDLPEPSADHHHVASAYRSTDGRTGVMPALALLHPFSVCTKWSSAEAMNI